jgi:Uma2 family endonuclease
MLTVEKKKKYTAEDYMMLEEGSPFQLVENNLVMSPSPSLIHQLILGELYDTIKAFVKQQQNPGLVILPPMDVYFDEDNIYQPDLIYISNGKIAEIVKDRIKGAPDMVIEILSPSNAYYDLRQKKDNYQKYGVKEYIIVDPIIFSCELYALKGGVYQLHQKAEKTEQLHSVILPGLTFDLAKIFA